MAAERRIAQRAQMRARLLLTALNLIAENGYDATTIDQIAEEADVARQTVLNHYPHKADFVATWRQHREDQLRTITETPAPDRPAAEALRRYYASRAALDERDRDLSLMLREQFIAPQPVPDAVLAAVRRGQGYGDFDRSIDPLHAAEVLTAVYADTVHRWLADVDSRFDLATALADKLDLVLIGLAGTDH
jgi:AcrR family transcriptional regulator